jgi:hypothetical protein
MKKAAVRSVLAASIVSLAVLLSMAGQVPVAYAQATHIRWDLITVTVTAVPFTITIDAGGSASAFANDNSEITLTGSGTFVAPAGGGGTSDAVTGGGTWQTSDPLGIATGSGTYQVTGLVRWEVAPGNQDGVVDHIGTGATYRAGLAVLRIEYSDGEAGVLTLSCMGLGTTSPAGVFEGITASKGYVDYWNREAPSIPNDENFTNFHVVR